MTNRINYLVIAVLLCSAAAHAQNKNGSCNVFQKQFTVSAASSASRIYQTRDNGYIITGTQTNDVFGNPNGLILKTDADGKKEWARGYTPPEGNIVFYGSGQLRDRSTATAGDLFDGRGFIQRVSKNGSLLWQKTYAVADGFLNFQLVEALPDGNFIAAGIAANANFEISGLLAKLTPSGNILWKKTYDISRFGNLPTSVATRGDTMFVAGIIPAVSFNAADTVFIIKVNSRNGNVYASKKIWLDATAVFHASIIRRTDNNLVLATTHSGQLTGITSNCLSVLTPGMTITRSVKVNTAADGEFSAAAQAPCGGVAVTFNNVSNDTGFIFKFNASLEPVFAKGYLPVSENGSAYRFMDIHPVNGGSYIISGVRNTAESSQVFVVKTDHNGNTGSCKNFSVTPSAENITLLSDNFECRTTSSLPIAIQEAGIPATPLAVSETDLCQRNHLCNNAGHDNRTVSAAAPVSAVEVKEETIFKVNVRNNPTRDAFTLEIAAEPRLPVLVRIISLPGRLVSTQTLGPGNRLLQVGSGWKPGVYLAEVLQGKNRKILKLVKL